MRYAFAFALLATSVSPGAAQTLSIAPFTIDRYEEPAGPRDSLGTAGAPVAPPVDPATLTPRTPPRPSVVVFAGTALRDVVTGSTDLSPTATGSVGIEFSGVSLLGRPSTWFAQVNAVAVADTVSDGYAATLLNPATGSFSGLLDVQVAGVLSDRLVLHPYVSVSSSVWRVQEETARAVTAGGAALLAFDVVSGLTVGDKSYALRLEGGPSARILLGDVTSERFEAAGEEALSSGERFFGGLELGMSFQIGDLTAGLQYYHFFGDEDGLTDGQLTGGIGLRAGLFRITPADT